jgi:uncharacterized protein (PEP-CTERM system associated)
MRTIPLIVALSGVAVGAHAQVSEPSSDAMSSDASESQALALPAGISKRAWRVESRVTMQETLTDNVAPGQAGKTSEQITELAPGLRVRGDTARLKMYLDYQLRQLYYAQGSRGAQTQNSLNSFGTLEAVEKLFFVDMSGTVSRQNISSFGVQSPSYYSSNSNSTETTNIRVSPYLRGKLGGYANYEARYSRSALRAKSSAASESDITDWRGSVNGDTPLTSLGWAAEGNRQQYDYSLGRKAESDSIRGRLTYRVNPQVKLLASVGRESNDFTTSSKQSWNNFGYGVEWRPTERTQTSAQREKRFFGYGHGVSIDHRFRHSAVRYTDNQDIASAPNQTATAGLGNIYDLIYSQMTSSIEDEAARAAFVSDYLQRLGIPPDTQVNAGFLTSQVTKMRRQELSYFLRGARNMLTLAASRSRNERLASGLGMGDDFSTASAVTQQGFNIGLSHQLTPETSLNVTGARSRSTADNVTSGANSGSTQKSLSATLSTKLGAKTNATVSARRTEVDGSLAPYTENAVVGSVSMRF